MSLQSNEAKREEYHRYLEKSGVIEYFSQVLVQLYQTPEKPADPNDFIREQLSKAFPDDTDTLRHEIMVLEARYNERDAEYTAIISQNYLLQRELEQKFNFTVNRDEMELLFLEKKLEQQQPEELKTTDVQADGEIVDDGLDIADAIDDGNDDDANTALLLDSITGNDTNLNAHDDDNNLIKDGTEKPE